MIKINVRVIINEFIQIKVI